MLVVPVVVSDEIEGTVFFVILSCHPKAIGKNILK